MVGSGSQLSWSHHPRLPLWCYHGNNLVGKPHPSEKKGGTGFEIRDGSVTRCEVVEQKEGLNSV